MFKYILHYFLCKEIYLDIKELQEEKIQNAKAKNQIAFLYKCMSTLLHQNHFVCMPQSNPSNAKT